MEATTNQNNAVQLFKTAWAILVGYLAIILFSNIIIALALIIPFTYFFSSLPYLYAPGICIVLSILFIYKFSKELFWGYTPKSKYNNRLWFILYTTAILGILTTAVVYYHLENKYYFTFPINLNFSTSAFIVASAISFVGVLTNRVLFFEQKK